jgi:hypothetical protein
MSKGWESKNVEEQMAAREQLRPAEKPASTQAARQTAVVSRRRQELELQREQVLNQRTSNPHRREALAAALAQIEQQLVDLDT